MILTSVCYKVAYDCPEAAQAHIARLAELNGVEPDIYQCEDCSYLHVGYSDEQRIHLVRTSYPRSRKQRKYDEKGQRRNKDKFSMNGRRWRHH